MTPQEALAQEKRLRRQAGEPDLTSQEETDWLREYQINQQDTQAREVREAGRGSVKTTMRGTKVMDGPYKGMTKPQMEQAILAGPTSARPPAAPRVASSVPQLPAGGRMVPGRSTGSQVYVAPGEQAWFEKTATAAPPPPPASPAAPTTAGARVMSSLGLPSTARPPSLQAQNPSSSASPPRRGGLIDGKPAAQWFQEAANRQGVANSYGTIRPQQQTATSTQTPPAVSAAPPTPKAAPAPSTRTVTTSPTRTAAPPRPSSPPPPSSVLADVNQGPPRFFAPTPSAAPLAPPSLALKSSAKPPPGPADLYRGLPPATKAIASTLSHPNDPQNWEYKPLPQTSADNLRRVAGAGSDGLNIAMNAIPALLQGPRNSAGSNSVLPTDIMGAQPPYPNALERLKGDTAAIQSAHEKGFLKTKKIPDPTEPDSGRKITQVLTPTLRGTDKRVRADASPLFVRGGPLTSAINPTAAPKFLQ